MNKITYSGRVIITKTNGEGEVVTTEFTNSGTTKLLDLLVKALDRSDSGINQDNKPYNLILGTYTDGNYTILNNLIFHLIDNPTFSYPNQTSKSIEFTFYVAHNGAIESGSASAIYLLLCDNYTTNGNRNLLAYVNTGSSKYNIASDETHVIKWVLTLGLEESTSQS